MTTEPIFSFWPKEGKKEGEIRTQDSVPTSLDESYKFLPEPRLEGQRCRQEDAKRAFSTRCYTSLESTLLLLFVVNYHNNTPLLS
jgi:hypothetical protein